MELRDVHSGCEKRYVKSINQDYGIYQGLEIGLLADTLDSFKKRLDGFLARYYGENCVNVCQLNPCENRGVCRHQEFHYRPKGSETCLPCDCYPIGSSSRACDQETGQCYCRPGLIGLIYDGCPKTSTAGVWWPRTKFGVPAAVPCPLPCWLKEKGWLEPDLFNCTYSAFVELSSMRNETEHNRSQEARLASAFSDRPDVSVHPRRVQVNRHTGCTIY
uniref:G-protein coupled receptors family 2 profile 1 domain-containing protein n=1 Tax=Xenopus tropicalis TaxID=8364 RepID=A0A1B8Y928_XENTR